MEKMGKILGGKVAIVTGGASGMRLASGAIGILSYDSE